MVYLETKLDFSGNDVKNIKAALDDPEPGIMCDISGWGQLEVSRYRNFKFLFQFFIFHQIQSGNMTAADHLQWANVPITSNKMCQDKNPLDSLDPEVMICAGGNVRAF